MFRRSLAFVLSCAAVACSGDEAAGEICSNENIVDDIDDGTSAAASDPVGSNGEGSSELAD